MRRGSRTGALVATTLAAFACAFASSALAGAGQNPPTGPQRRAAVRRAESSRTLWSTINICNSRAAPDRVGVRGQMPALGFPARLSMTIQVDYWAAKAKVFRPVPGGGARAAVRLGTVAIGLEQGGHTFRFGPAAGLLSATITFQWQLQGRVIGSVTREATGGHRGVDGGSPPHHSAGTCRIG